MKYKLFFLLLLLVVIVLPEVSYSQNLVLNPNRIVFEGKKRKDQLLVNNPSNEQQTYRITFENKQMLEDGKYSEVEDKDPNGKYSDKLVRFSPRTFTLAPKTSQTVRIQLRKPKGLEDGEYRSHMKVSVVPQAQAPKVQENDSVNIQIKVHYGITIPIIVRNGKLSYSTEIASSEVTKNEENDIVLKARINRTGGKSVYGDLSVTHYDNAGKSTVLKFLPGVSVFTPNTHRTFEIKLDLPEGVNISSGNIEVKYVDRQTEAVAAIKTIKL